MLHLEPNFASCYVVGLLVMMQAQNEAPPDNQCKDKFLIQSVVAVDGATTKDITHEMVARFYEFTIFVELWLSMVWDCCDFIEFVELLVQ